MTLLHQNVVFFLEEEGRIEKTLIESKISIFQFAFQKQGLKQLFHPSREGDQSCTKLIKDGTG
jgi:hypothetical protein